MSYLLIVMVCLLLGFAIVICDLYIIPKYRSSVPKTPIAMGHIPNNVPVKGKLYNHGFGMCLKFADNDDALVLSTCDDTRDKKWVLHNVSVLNENKTKIIHNNKCLTPGYGGYGTDVQTRKCANNSIELDSSNFTDLTNEILWDFSRPDKLDGAQKIKHTAVKNGCLDLDFTGSDPVLVMKKCQRVPSQLWSVLPI